MLNIEICKEHCGEYIDSILTAIEGQLHWSVYCSNAVPNYECFGKMDKWECFARSDATKSCPYYVEHCMEGWNNKGRKNEEDA